MSSGCQWRSPLPYIQVSIVWSKCSRKCPGLHHSFVRDWSSCFLHLARQTFPTCAYLSLCLLLLRIWSTTVHQSVLTHTNDLWNPRDTRNLEYGGNWENIGCGVVRAVLIEEQKMVVKVLKGQPAASQKKGKYMFSNSISVHVLVSLLWRWSKDDQMLCPETASSWVATVGGWRETESMLLTALLFLHIHNILFIYFFYLQQLLLPFLLKKEKTNHSFVSMSAFFCMQRHTYLDRHM